MVSMKDSVIVDDCYVDLFRKYKDQYGNVAVEPNWVIPIDVEKAVWPEWSWGLPFGRYANDLRIPRVRRKIPKEIKQQLNDLGFAWKLSDIRKKSKVQAFQRYKELYNDSLSIPRNFVVPSDSKLWPKDAWGMALGRILFLAQTKTNKHSDIKSGLKKLGFQFPLNDILLGFRAYKRVTNSTDLEDDFVIPESEKYPQSTWNMRLGEMYKLLRNTTEDSYVRLRMRVMRHGFVVRNDHIAAKAFEVFKSIFKHLNVPNDFVIPSGSTEWPRVTWDLPLGIICEDLKHHRIFPLIRNKMNRLGFKYGPERLGDKLIMPNSMSEEELTKEVERITIRNEALWKHAKQSRIMKYLKKERITVKKARKIAITKRIEAKQKKLDAEELRFHRANKHLKKILTKRKDAAERKEIKRAKRRLLMKRDAEMKLRVKKLNKPIVPPKSRKLLKRKWHTSITNNI